jgi:hypothetical protein
LIRIGKKQHNAEGNQDGTETDAGAVPNRFSQMVRQVRYELGRPYRWWHGGDPTANATAVLAVVTLSLVLVNVGMLFEMRRSGDQQHKDTISALAKTDTTIAALEAQAEVLRGQLDVMKTDSVIKKNDLAAKMTMVIERNITAGEFTITAHWTNNGKTDAIGFKGWDDFKVFTDNNEMNSFPFSDPITSGVGMWEGAGFDITPGEGTLFHTKFISNQDAWDIMYGRSFGVFWGYVQYRDIFNGFHTIRDCHILVVESNGRGGLTLQLPHVFRQSCNERTHQNKPD